MAVAFEPGIISYDSMKGCHGSSRISGESEHYVEYGNRRVKGRCTKMLKKKKLFCLLLVLFLISNVILSGTPSEAASGKWKRDNKGWWYSYSDGTYAKSSWKNIGGKWYHFNAAGYMQTGWKKLGGKWYYLGKDGAMATGWKKLGGKWYLFDASGVMQTGWKKRSGKWYLFDASGVMQTGWKKNSGKWYYFASDGQMVINKEIGGGHIGADGVWVENGSGKYDWAKKYKEIAIQYNKDVWDDPIYRTEYTLSYIDGDDIPELLIRASKHGRYVVHTYYNGKVATYKTVSDDIDVTQRTGLIHSPYDYKGTGEDEVLKVSKGKIIRLGGGEYTYPFFNTSDPEEYYWEEVKVSRSTYMSKLKSLYPVRDDKHYRLDGVSYLYEEFIQKMNSYLSN